MFRLSVLVLALWSSLASPSTWSQTYDDGYALNAGDSVRIHVYGELDLSFNQLLIGQNGRISYPFLGELTVTGKTASQLQAELTAGLKPDYLVDPRISVSVVRYRPFFVNGEVRSPGGVDFQPGLTLRKAISLAGGFTERANKKQALVISDSDPERREQKVALDYSVQPGDIITVQDTFFLDEPGSCMNIPGPQTTQAFDDSIVDLGRMFRVVMRNKWAILGLAFAIALASGLAVYSVEPVYKATASIVLESEEANVVNVEQVYSLGAGNYEYSQTQFEILRSRSLAERVVRKLALDKHTLFQPAVEGMNEKPWYSFNLRSLLPASRKAPPLQLGEEARREHLIQSLTSMVAGGFTVSPVEYSFVVYISFEYTDPQLAAQIVNAVAREFINSNLETRISGTVQATGWLSERLEELKENLRDSERALQDFREREGLVSVEGVTGLGGNELKVLSQRMEDARKARIEAQNIKDDVQNMPGATTAQLMTIPAVLQHQLIRDLTREQSAAERRVAELSKRYGPKHPKMIAARSDLNAADSELASEVRNVVSGINREYEIALRNEQQLQATWEASKTEVQDFNRKEFKLQELQREVDTNRELYNIFFTRIKGVSETGGFEKPHARIIDKAMVPSSPFKPNKRRAVILAFVFGLLFGSGIAILLDYLDNTIKSPDDIDEKLHAPLLGTIPKMKVDKNGDFEQYWQQQHGQYAEALRTIRTGVVLAGLDKPAKIIVVTSTVPGEGKSTVALNLGATLAQLENTLVIGADLRRPSLARKCGLSTNHSGLTHFVSGTAELDDCIEHLPELNLYVMPAGFIPPNPLEVISSKKFVQALKYLRERFDRIVIDTAPVQAVSDALILASNADSIIYVVKADATSATQVQKGIANVLASNEPLTGVVLNQFDAKNMQGYYGSKYRQDSDYYQSDDMEKA